jgi:hypothetical protein
LDISLLNFKKWTTRVSGAAQKLVIVVTTRVTEAAAEFSIIKVETLRDQHFRGKWRMVYFMESIGRSD